MSASQSDAMNPMAPANAKLGGVPRLSLANNPNYSQLSSGMPSLPSAPAPQSTPAFGMALNQPSSITPPSFTSRLPNLDQINALESQRMISPELAKRARDHLAKSYPGMAMAQQKMEQGTQLTFEGQKLQAENAVKQSEQEVPLQKELVAEAEAETLRRQQYAQKARDMSQEQMRDLKQAQSEYMNTQIDPTRALQGSRGIWAAVAAGLGSIGSAMTGGPNTGLQIVNNAIDRDIDAQRAELEKKGRAVDMKSNLYAQSRKILGDDNLAFEAASIARTQEIGRKQQMIAMNMAPSKARADLLSSAGGLLDAAAQREMKLNTDVETFNYHKGMLGLEALKVQAEREKAKATLGRVPAEQAVKLGKAGSIIEQINDLQKDYNEKVVSGRMSPLTTGVSQIVPSSEAGKYGKKREILGTQIANALSGTSMTDDQIKRLINLLPGLWNTSETSSANFDALKQEFSAGILAEEKALTRAGYNAEGISGLRPTIESSVPSFKPGRVEQ